MHSHTSPNAFAQRPAVPHRTHHLRPVGRGRTAGNHRFWRMTLAGLTLVSMAITGCGESADNSDAPSGWERSEAGVAPNAPTITEPQGEAPSELEIVDLEVGTGAEVTNGSIVSVDYTGALFDDGTVFDASYDREPFELEVGAGQVIPGWDQGLLGMQSGGVRQLIIPSDLAYGAAGRAPIPPNATLIFIVTLRSIQT